jgi:NADP-dependent 3-hydroxy acid dehydrogenase YdfG
MSVEGKVVAITGASGGIGEATALLLAERGAKLLLGARRNDRLAALAEMVARGSRKIRRTRLGGPLPAGY